MFLHGVDAAHPLQSSVHLERGSLMPSSKNQKRARIEIEFWFEEDGSIRVTSDAGPDFHVRVRAEPLKRNGHPSLYRRLARILKDASTAIPKE